MTRCQTGRMSELCRSIVASLLFINAGWCGSSLPHQASEYSWVTIDGIEWCMLRFNLNDSFTYESAVVSRDVNYPVNDTLPTIDRTTSGKVVVPSGCSYTSNSTPKFYKTTVIDKYAFNRCSKLTGITLPSTITNIGYHAFEYCTSLKTINIPQGTCGIGGGAFFDCRSLTGIVIPSSVRTIPSEAFSGCSSLASVEISNGVEQIGYRAFDNCVALKSIRLPSSVNIIYGYSGEGVFGTCSNLEEIVVDKNNPIYGTSGGLLYASYNGNYRDLIRCPLGRKGKIVIPSGVGRICSDGFRGCTQLTRVAIPTTVSNIATSAFSGCVNLQKVFLPTSRTTLTTEVANGVPNAMFLYYEGESHYYYNSEDVAAEIKSPNPPMSRDSNISITPTTRNFGGGGGGGAIITSGSGTWTAAVSDTWIVLNTTSGSVGYPVAYVVDANVNAESRTGYVYVSGYTHTVTQEGCGGELDPSGAEFETAGGNGVVNVSVANGVAWKAIPNVDWLYVSPTSGTGSGTVRYIVEPLDEVTTRSGTITIAGQTFTVFQYGRRIELNSYSTTQNYETHVIPITVNALAITQWSVTPNNSWISVVDAGNGQGGDLVTIAIAENPSYKARTGTVRIGTETFTVRQQGRPTAALSFDISPSNSTASVEGANGLIAVTATPDLPWVATSGANWITVYAATTNGAGNGNVVYSASPNPKLYSRTGTVTITPEAASGVAAKTHTVTQPAATAAISYNGYEFEAAGESCSVDVSCASIVEWSISESLSWLSVNGSTSRVGPGTVTLQATANDTVYPRSGTVTIAGKTFRVSQKARGVELEYDTKLFDTDGGYESISIHPDGNVSWTAVASDATWITIFQGDSGTGDGEIMYIVSPYNGNGTARMGWITVGSQKVYITQRAYDLTIEPNGTNVVGNAGAGEFGVAAGSDDVWTAIVTEPWVTLVSGYDAGTGSGVVRFLYTENDTGKTRMGKIIVAGEVYTLEQRARTMVAISATAEHGGHVSGGGSYDLGTQVTLEAVPDSGYAFSYWTGAVSSMQNPLTVTADVAKSYMAVFAPLPIAFTSVVSDTTGVTLSWNNLAWAGTYRIYRGVTSVPSSAVVLVELQNSGNCTYLDTTGDVDVEYWYWIEAEGPSDEVMSDPMTGRKEKPIVYSAITYENLRGATNLNPATYREGTLVSFQNPGAVTGYTFAGWTPSQITAEMTGTQTVRAAWTANSYSIAYNPSGGSGTMSTTAATYDSETTVAANGFTWTGHVFTGWATNASGEVVYAAGQHVTNLTSQSSGVVTLYAVWDTLEVAPPQIFPADGSEFTGDACEVMILCATEDATIYYSPSGTTPRLTDAYLYTGPFSITDTATIKAIAVLDGVRSEYVTATITKRVLSLGAAVSADAAGAALNWTTGGDAQWTAISDTTTSSGYSAQSGTIGDATGVGFSTTWLQTEVSGAGTISFRWKVDCESDDSGDMTWDHVAFYTNGVEAARMDGTSGWEELSFTFSDTGTHTLRWAFMKDDYNEEVCADRAWVSGFTWTPPPDPIPEISGDADVADALAGSADSRLVNHIKTVAEYNAYRGWVNAKGLDHQTVKSSARAWFSYAIEANGLVERDFQNEDVTIGSPTPTSDGGLSFKVDVRGALIGAGATPANLESVFRVQGAYSLRENAFTSKNVVSEISASVNGSIAVTVRPKHATGAFFARMCLYADGEPGPEPDEVLPPSCTVTFDANGGVGGTTVSVLQWSALETLPTPTREGYEFKGWFTAVSGGTQVTASTIVMADVTYYAHWTRGKVQLWNGGPYWATMNIGAEKPEDYGLHFWWGDTIGYRRENNAWVASDGSSSNFSFSSDNAPNYGKNKATLQSEGWITADGVLAPEHDAAHVQWGGDWRMPTEQELSDLNSNCDWTWTTKKGVTGYVVRGRGDYATSSIFLPAAGYGFGTSLECVSAGGYYWFSDPKCELYFNIDEHRKNVIDSDFGFTVRPVQGSAE